MTIEERSEFLGVGWSLPVGLRRATRRREGQDVAYDTIAEAAYEERVRQSIWIVLGTARGERVMRPDFGCGIHDLVFSVGDAATIARVGDEVRQALLLWEPRIDLLDVTVAADPAQPTTLLIGIEYRVRATNNFFNSVYPFYLERGGGS